MQVKVSKFHQEYAFNIPEPSFFHMHVIDHSQCKNFPCVADPVGELHEGPQLIIYGVWRSLYERVRLGYYRIKRNLNDGRFK